MSRAKPQIEIVTNKYADLARACLDPLNGGEPRVNFRLAGNGVLHIQAEYSAALKNALLEIMEHIVITENAAVGGSPHLAGALRRAVFSDRQAQIWEQFMRFAYKSCVNLDGYVRFCLFEYANRLNILLYCIAKKEVVKNSVTKQ